MNKRGFTLVELLAVIAILAILVVMLVPNFIGLFKQSKENTLIIETQSLMKQAQQQWILGGAKAMTFKTGGTELEVENGETFKYCIIMSSDGKFTGVGVDNGEYAAYWKPADTGIVMSALQSTDIYYKNGDTGTKYDNVSSAIDSCNGTAPNDAIAR